MAQQEARFDTVLPADVVEVQGQDLAVGCYELVEGQDRRRGRLWILDARSLEPRCFWEDSSGGVLDLRWYGDRKLVAACADGTVVLLRRDETELVERGRTAVGTSLVLSVDVEAEESLVACSAADGSLNVVQVDIQTVTWTAPEAHDYEVWTVAFHRDKNTILSGSDDGRICVWDLRASATAGHVLAKRAAHGGLGVTAIRSDPVEETIVITGGYDDHIRHFDLRSMQETVSSPTHIGGGPWRIKPNPEDARSFLVPGMYAGAFLLYRFNEHGALTVVSQYSGHESIVYGAAWSYGLPVTCSFYDHSVHTWSSLDHTSNKIRA